MTFWVLKWPEQRYFHGEKAALKAWHGSAGPQVHFEEDFFVMEFFSGRNPFFWNKQDLDRLEALFREMQQNQPRSKKSLRPLREHLSVLRGHLEASDLPFAQEAADSFPSNFRETELIHGDLHPWNIFMRDQAHVIDPYGLQGDPGFDLAFLAASLANDQEDFLREMISRLDLPTARDWFPGIVAYRLDSTLRHKEKRQSRVLRDLARRVWS